MTLGGRSGDTKEDWQVIVGGTDRKYLGGRTCDIRGNEQVTSWGTYRWRYERHTGDIKRGQICDIKEDWYDTIWGKDSYIMKVGQMILGGGQTDNIGGTDIWHKEGRTFDIRRDGHLTYGGTDIWHKGGRICGIREDEQLIETWTQRITETW